VALPKMEENVSEPFHWMCPPQFFLEIHQDFWIKKTRLSVSFGDNRTMFPIPQRQKQTQIITVFAPIDGRTRVGFAASTRVHIENRGLL
jgi:hypothetical protein